MAGYVTHKEPPLRPHGPVIAAQCFEQFGRKHNVPILLPFALLHAHDHSLAVDITGLEADGFGDAQAGGVTGSQDGTMLGTADAFQEVENFLRAQDYR